MSADASRWNLASGGRKDQASCLWTELAMSGSWKPLRPEGFPARPLPEQAHNRRHPLLTALGRSGE